MCGLVATKMRVKAGPGVMERDGDTTPGQMDNPVMEEVSNTISPSISSPHPVVGMMKILVQRRGSSASIQVDTVNSKWGAKKRILCVLPLTICSTLTDSYPLPHTLICT